MNQTRRVRSSQQRWQALIVLSLFLVSGAVGLVLEVAWTRQLTAVFGNTVFAASTVLSSFMLGLALGSFLIGRIADRHPRPLRLYGILELGIGAYALGFPWLLSVNGGLYGWCFRTFDAGFWAMTSVRFSCSLILLLPPTLLMGGTLPVLTRHLGAGRPLPGRVAGWLYGVNTFGAVLGCFLAGFVLIEWLGVRGALWAAAGMAVLVGLTAFVLDARQPTPVAGAAASTPRKPKRVAREKGASSERDGFARLCVAFSASGFCALACEVIWTRVLLFLLTTSVYAFAIMLTVFLVGNALGALLSAWLVVPRLKQPAGCFGGLQVLIGGATLLSAMLLARLPAIESALVIPVRVGGAWEYLVNYFADAAVVMLLPTLLMGAAFPVMAAAGLRSSPALADRLGRLYAANTVGCVLGSLAAAFLLIPWLGTYGSLLFVTLLNLAIGAMMLWRFAEAGGTRWRWVAAGGLAAWLFAVAAGGHGRDPFRDILNAYHQPGVLAFVREHATGTVTVHDMAHGDRLISVDGVDVAGRDFMLRTTQKLQGYLPLLLHPRPEKVAQIGFGCGETARVGLEFGVPDYTVVEICPAVFEAGDFFTEQNRGSNRDPRIRRVIMDGKNFMRLTDERFDVIMNDSIYPGSSGSSALYTLDHFRNCRDRLAEGGLFSCWVPLDLRPREMGMILRSFLEVFPDASFWVASNCVNKNGVIIGTREPLQIDFQRVKTLCERPDIRAELEPIAIADVYDLLDCHLLDAAAVRAFVGDAPLNRDDHPVLEFSCARKQPWQVRLLTDLAALVEHHAPVTPSVVNFPNPEANRAELDRRFRATTHVFRAQVAQLTFEPNLRQAELQAALAANPDERHVRTLETEVVREIAGLRLLADRYPDLPTPRQRLADKLYAAHDFAAAAPLYRDLIRRGLASDDSAFVRLAEIDFNAGRAADAEGVLRSGLSRWPDSPELHDRLAGLFLRTARLAEARVAIARALQLAPEHPVYQEHQRRIEAAR